MIRKAAVFILIVLVITGGWFAWKKINTPSKTTFFKYASNIQSPERIGDKIYYFTGSSFANYDLASSKTTRLSNYFYTTGEIGSFEWSETDVTFNVVGADSSDSFGQAVVKAGGHAASSNWWMYNFDTKRLELLLYDGIESCSGLIRVNKELYCFSSDLKSRYKYLLSSYSLKDGAKTELTNIDGAVSSVSASADGIFYLTPQESGSQTLNIFSINDRKTSAIYSSKDRIMSYAVSPSSYILVSEAELLSGTPTDERTARDEVKDYAILKQRLVYLDPGGTNLDSKSFDAPSGDIEPGEDGSLYFVAQNGISFRAEGSKLEKNNATYGQDLIAVAWSLASGTYYVDWAGILFSNVNKELKPVDGSSFDESKNLATSLFYVRNVKNGINEAVLFDFKHDFKTNTEQVDKFLRDLGYDPNQFRFKWGIEGIDDDIKIPNEVVIRK